jgi:hypothetical protein
MEAEKSEIEKTQKEAMQKYQPVDYRIRKLQVCNRLSTNQHHI